MLHHKSYHTSNHISSQALSSYHLIHPRKKHVNIKRSKQTCEEAQLHQTSIFTSKQNPTQRCMFMWMHDLPLLTLQQLNSYGIMHEHMNA